MEEPKPKKKRRCRGWWWKAPLWSVVTLLLLLCAAIGTGLWLLTPQRLTGLVNRYGTEFLHNGTLHANRVELTWRSSFPRLELTIDSLAVRSDDVPDSVATLLAVERLHGAVNLAHMLKGAITIYDVSITRPQVCVYTGTNGQSNLNILPSSTDDDTEKESSDIVIPPLKLERFIIEGDAPLRYISEQDSLDVDVTLRLLSVENHDPTYQVNTSILASRLPAVALPDSFAIGFNGGVEWTPESPLTIGLRKFRLWAGEAAAQLNAMLDLNDPLTISELDITTDDISPAYLTDLARMQPGAEIPPLTSDNHLRLSVRLLQPYSIADTLLPAVRANVEITPGRLSVPSMRMRFRNVALKAEAELTDPSDLNSAVIKLEKLDLTGDRGATSVSLEGNATNLFADPKVEGHLTGNIILHQLPPPLLRALGVQMKGRLYADTGFKFRLSHLNSRQIHRLKLRGMAKLTDFFINMPADTLEAFAGHAELRFGTSQSFVSDRGRADSLLTISLKIDTASATISDLSAALSGLRCGIGVRNDGTFGDTTTVTPLGGRFIADRLRIVSATDSMRAMLRDIDIAARLGRHEGDRKTPELNLALTSRSIVYAQKLTRLTLRRSEITAAMHLTKRRTPTARRDTAMMARRRHITDSIAASTSVDDEETIDFGLDRKSRSLLRRLQLDGTLKARSGRLFTPLYPLRMAMRNLDFHFTADSLMLHGVELQAGQSDFKATGEVTELRRALTARRNKVPLKIRFNLHADTININELTQAAFRGAALAARLDSLGGGVYAVSDTIDDDATIEQSMDSMAVTEIAAVLIPANINADLRFSADNIIYSNLLMHDFAGTVQMNNGGLSLQELRASTEAGSVDLNALYYAPTRQDIDFALGLKLNRFKIKRVIELMPQLDSIMPILGTLGGIIDVGLGATVELDSAMNLRFPTLRAMMKLSGDSLVVLDESTYKTMAKWLRFKNRQHNMIDHMSVDLSIRNSMLELYPFIFDFDRYRIGVMGHNDLDLNLNYHVSVLKSPLPFKFGINITGPAENMKIRPGKARFKEKMAAERVAIADSARVNLVQEMRSVFRRGVQAAKVGPLHVAEHQAELTDTITAESDTLTTEQLRQLEIQE